MMAVGNWKCTKFKQIYVKIEINVETEINVKIEIIVKIVIWSAADKDD